MAAKETLDTRVALVQQDVKYIKDGFDKLDEKISAHYVTKEEFDPVKKIVYGLVGLILITVVGSIVSLVLIRGS